MSGRDDRVSKSNIGYHKMSMRAVEGGFLSKEWIGCYWSIVYSQKELGRCPATEEPWMVVRPLMVLQNHCQSHQTRRPPPLEHPPRIHRNRRRHRHQDGRGRFQGDSGTICVLNGSAVPTYQASATLIRSIVPLTAPARGHGLPASGCPCSCTLGMMSFERETSVTGPDSSPRRGMESARVTMVSGIDPGLAAFAE
jgi:hypothetical protein